MYKLLLIGQRPLYFRHRYFLVTKEDVHFSIKPVRIAADKNLRLRFRCIKPEILQGFKTKYRCFVFLHRIHKKEKPVILQHIGAFQRQRGGIFVINKIGMQVLQRLDKLLFFFAVTMHHKHFIRLRYYHFITVLCLCLVSFVGERGLKHEVFPFFHQVELHIRIAILYFLDQGLIKINFMFTGQGHDKFHQRILPLRYRYTHLTGRQELLHQVDHIITFPKMGLVVI